MVTLRSLGIEVCFNPRARDGREKDGKTDFDNIAVSIHAPVMDANMRALALLVDGSFNPRARDGREFYV